MKKFLKKLWASIKALYEKLINTTQKFVPVAIAIVEAIKMVMDSPVDDVILFIIKKAIPGDADDKLIDKIKSVVEQWIPKILLELKIINSIAGITNLNDQLNAILAEIKKLSPETQAILWHGFASLCIEKLSDGKISWSDGVALAEYYYQNMYKTKTS